MSFWTAERVETLKAHFAAGLSAEQIYRAMHAPSRCSVGGKLYRLGLQRGRTPTGISPSTIARAPRRKTVQRARLTPPPAPKPAPARAPAPAHPNPCGLLELTNETCRFPIAPEGEPYVACGALEADVSKGVPYCTAHMRLCYRRPGERQEAA